MSDFSFCPQIKKVLSKSVVIITILRELEIPLGLIYQQYWSITSEHSFECKLFDELKSISDKNETIDFWIISHIHVDHIGGVVKYIKVINSGDFSNIGAVITIWANPKLCLLTY